MISAKAQGLLHLLVERGPLRSAEIDEFVVQELVSVKAVTRIVVHLDPDFWAATAIGAAYYCDLMKRKTLEQAHTQHRVLAEERRNRNH